MTAEKQAFCPRLIVSTYGANSKLPFDGQVTKIDSLWGKKLTKSLQNTKKTMKMIVFVITATFSK